MKLYVFLLGSALAFLSSPAQTGNGAEVSGAQRIVVITADEAIHYARGCAFYELRGLVTRSLGGSVISETTGPVLFELRLIGVHHVDTIYVGDHWIRTGTVTTEVEARDFDQLRELIEMRRGSGVAKSRIEFSVEAAARLINDPLYIEDNRCQRANKPDSTL